MMQLLEEEKMVMTPYSPLAAGRVVECGKIMNLRDIR